MSNELFFALIPTLLVFKNVLFSSIINKHTKVTHNSLEDYIDHSVKRAYSPKQFLDKMYSAEEVTSALHTMKINEKCPFFLLFTAEKIIFSAIFILPAYLSYASKKRITLPAGISLFILLSYLVSQKILINPKNAYKSFKKNLLCNAWSVNKNRKEDSIQPELIRLRYYQAQSYIEQKKWIDVCMDTFNKDLKDLCTALNTEITTCKKELLNKLDAKINKTVIKWEEKYRLFKDKFENYSPKEASNENVLYSLTNKLLPFVFSCEEKVTVLNKEFLNIQNLILSPPMAICPDFSRIPGNSANHRQDYS